MTSQHDDDVSIPARNPLSEEDTDDTEDDDGVEVEDEDSD